MAKTNRLEPLARVVLRTQPDSRLVALAREGVEPAFDEIVRRYRGALVPFAAIYAPGGSVEDVVQESFVRAWAALRNAPAGAEIHLRPWLYTIVRNRALNARRDDRPHEQLDENIDGVPRPNDLVLAKEELEEVVRAVNDLPAAQREALVRSSLDGEGHEQIASALGVTPGAVRQLIFRARVSLRQASGALLPLPAVRAVVELGSGQAWTLAAGGAGTGAAISAAGGSLTAKLAAVAAIGAVSAGAGVAIERGGHEDARSTTKPAAIAAPAAASPVPGSQRDTEQNSSLAVDRTARHPKADRAANRADEEAPVQPANPAPPQAEREVPQTNVVVGSYGGEEPAPRGAGGQSSGGKGPSTQGANHSDGAPGPPDGAGSQSGGFGDADPPAAATGPPQSTSEQENSGQGGGPGPSPPPNGPAGNGPAGNGNGNPSPGNGPGGNGNPGAGN